MDCCWRTHSQGLKLSRGNHGNAKPYTLNSFQAPSRLSLIQPELRGCIPTGETEREGLGHSLRIRKDSSAGRS